MYPLLPPSGSYAFFAKSLSSETTLRVWDVLFYEGATVFFIRLWLYLRLTDELVDGPNASHIKPTALDRWESRLEDLFRGRPFDILDATLSDNVTNRHSGGLTSLWMGQMLHI
ncbi:hypothetical protein vseg_017591 [Gypsophila vaccaria]